MRLTRRRLPPDCLSPMSLLAAAAAAATAFIITCCSAGVAGIPRQLSTEVEEHPGGGGKGGKGGPLFPFPVRPPHYGETGEGYRQRQTKALEKKENDDGKALEDDNPGTDWEEDEERGMAAPPYMLELYGKFSNDRHSYPMADIVRSFKNINTVTSVWTSDNCTSTALHSLHFNISSSSEYEDVQMAELRFLTPKKTLTILVYEVIAPSPGITPSPPPPLAPRSQPRFRLLASREVSPLERSAWQAFSVTEALRRSAKDQATSGGGHVFQVRVDTVHRSNTEAADAAVSDVIVDDDETILVVFSNERKRRRGGRRESREIGRRRRRSRRHNYPPSSSTPRPSSPEKEEEGEEEEEESTSGKRPPIDRELLKNQSRRGRKGRKRRKGRKGRDSCRRKPMYVDFQDVKWENRIIEPPGYQAYECTGHCYYPIGQRLTPTKYAVVKSLLHATYPKRASSACCVPTRLEPIALLYKDEQGIVTYQYQYEDMVVAECGCR